MNPRALRVLSLIHDRSTMDRSNLSVLVATSSKRPKRNGSDWAYSGCSRKAVTRISQLVEGRCNSRCSLRVTRNLQYEKFNLDCLQGDYLWGYSTILPFRTSAFSSVSCKKVRTLCSDSNTSACFHFFSLISELTSVGPIRFDAGRFSQILDTQISKTGQFNQGRTNDADLA
jgi:hypothetical protein